MSAYDELYQSALARRRKDHTGSGTPPGVGLLEDFDLKRIGAAIERARMREGEPVAEHFVLPDYPGQTATLTHDGEAIGQHGLVLRGGDRFYVAHLAVVGRLLPLLVAPRAFLRDPAQERLDEEQFGPVCAIPVRDFSRFTVRCRSAPQVSALLDDELILALIHARRSLNRVTVLPGAEGVHIDVVMRADDPSEAPPGIALARAAHAAALRAAATAGGFVAGATDRSSPDEGRVTALLDDVDAAIAFLAGHAERVGAGVEARMELDDPAGLAGAVRVEPTPGRRLAVVVTGALRPVLSSAVAVSPERSVLARARGLFDRKVGDPELDRAFLIDGNAEAARLLLTDAPAALALVARGARLALDAGGVHVHVGDLLDEDDAVVDVVSASLALWRAAAQRHAGLATAQDP